jgi:DNA polymerase-4
MAALPVHKIWGIGPKSSERFAERGILTCADLLKIPLPEMLLQFGKWGEELYRLCRGEDDREVEPHRISKSLSNETTFSDNLVSLEQCQAAITELSWELLEELRQKAPERKIRKAFVKVKFADFTRTTRESLCIEPSVEIYQTLLTEAFGRKDLPVRLLGTGVRFEEEHTELEEKIQQELFESDQ